jgi:tetratricopeptide (TPR) repeat protein
MSSFLLALIRWFRGIPAAGLAVLTRAGQRARRRPALSAVAAVLVLLAGAGAGLYGYGLHEWHAARAALKAGRPEEAQRHLGYCLWLWPGSVQVHLLAGRACRLRGDFEGAEGHLNRCLKLQHGATEAVQVEFLLMRVQGGEEDEVAPELISLYVENNSPESAMILETLARAYMVHLRYGPAFTCLSRWAQVEPDSAEPLRWRGWVLEQLNDHPGAMNDYLRALELDPDQFAPRLRLAEMYLERSDPTEALPHLEYLSKKYSDRPVVQARLGQCRFLQGQMEEARRLLEGAVEQLPTDPQLLITLAKLENQEGRPAEAEKWLRRVLKADPTDTEAEFALAGSLQAQGRWDESKVVMEQFQKDTAMLKRVGRLLQREAESPSTDPAALAEVGTVFLHNNERVGLYWLNRALQRDPTYQPAHKALAEYYEGKGDVEKAAYHRSRLKPDKVAAEATSSK